MKRHNREANLLNITMVVLALALLMTIPRQTSAQTNTFPSSGNAGVGTTSPNSPMTVVGNIGSEANSSFNSGVGLLGIDSGNGYLQLYDSTRTLKTYFSSRSGVTNYINNGANFGIGTASPGGKLDVRDGSLYLSDTNVSQPITGVWPAATYLSMAPLSGTAGGSYVTGLSDTNATAMAFEAIIGSSDPTDTTPAMAFAAGKFSNSSSAQALGSSETAFQFKNNSSNLMTILGSGNVGIGTTSPAHKLTVSGGWLALDNGYGLAAKDSGGTARTVIYLDSANNIQVGNTSFTPNVVFNNTGNVGIGQSSPAYKLDVNGTAHVSGNMTVDGNLAAKYQDVAEWVPASGQLSAGTVVVLDSTRSNQVISSSQAYDTRVAGVISEQPGIALGESGSGKVLVAATGRVRVKVDASRAPIRIGDLLVTSDINGVAMKSEPVNLGGVQLHRPGTLIGKALEPLDKGTGTILVLLSLQ